ncbi:MAG: ribosome biogenesis GTP-binding protein YihA/YsxC [Mycoplasma sp.]|nr:ribosome biogenesis GTP-binding protein YihA/YsxC [Mycoplasma sp.]
MVEFIKSAASKKDYPHHENIEVCFIGRSNVGKSSLINALTKKKIAYSSKMPGRTKLINFFQWNDVVVVDLPGYGYNKLSKKESKEVTKMVCQYFTNREKIDMVLLLVDTKVGPTNDDIEMIEHLIEINKPFKIVLTKSDKAKQTHKAKTLNKITKMTNNFIMTSSSTNGNISELRKFIHNL